MNAETHSQLASFIWDICNLLRGPYKRNEYRKVILPMTVLRRFDCLLAPTKERVLKEHASIKGKPETVVHRMLERVTGRPFYNLSKLDLGKLLADPNQLAPNLNGYIQRFSKNVREIMERFAFDQQIARMAEKNLLYEVVKKFATVDLSPQRVDNVQMGYVFEELIRIGAEQSNEEAGEHFTPREVIKLMVNLLLSPESDLRKSHVVKTIYDPACGTGGMLSVAESYIRAQNAKANPQLFGQDWNDEAWAVCKSDMLIKGEDADNIRLGDSFTKDAFDRHPDGTRITFDYMLANPPFGVEWKQQQKDIEKEHDELRYDGRFGAGLPRINDGSLLFLQHMLAKMRAPKDGGSRIAIVFNGSPLFTGDAGSGESNIRQWMIENDWLEAIVALPDQLFYNTGISTYIWVLTNRKAKRRRGKIQLVDARNFFIKMKKSLGNKRNKLGDEDEGEPDQIGDIARIHGDFSDGEMRTFTIEGTEKTLVVSKLFDNADFGYRKITVERPLRLNFQASAERIARLEEEPAFQKLASSNKKAGKARDAEIAAGRERQEEITVLLRAFADAGGSSCFKRREEFVAALRELVRTRDARLSGAELKAVLHALSERDEAAEICRDHDGKPEPDPELRDSETVPLKESIQVYLAREVLPHVPDAWIDEAKTKVGYEIPLNRHFYRFDPPRPLAVIDAEIRALESDVVELLRGVTARGALISRTVTRGLPPDIARYAGFDPSPKLKTTATSWLGEVPAHWDVKPLGYMVRILGGATPDKSKASYWDGDIPWVSPKDMKRPRISDAEDHVTEHALLNSPLAMIPMGSVLVVVRGMILAHSFPVALTEAPVTINQDMKALQSGKAITPEFLFWVLSGFGRVLVSFADESAHGTRKLETATLAKFRLAVPPLAEQHAIANFLDQETRKFDQTIRRIEDAIACLDQYRAALIDAAVTGKISSQAGQRTSPDAIISNDVSTITS